MPSNRRKAGALSSGGFGTSPAMGALFGAPAASQFKVDPASWFDPANDRPTPRPTLRAATKAKGTLTHAAAGIVEKGALALGKSERDAAQLASRFEQANLDWNPLSMADVVGTQANLGVNGDRDFSKSDLLTNAALIAAPEVLPLVAKGALKAGKRASPTLKRLMADERGSLGQALPDFHPDAYTAKGAEDTLDFGNGRIANIGILTQEGMDARLAQTPNPFQTAVAKDGAPVPVYHGTIRDQADFNPGHPRATWFAEKPELANRYADARAHRKVSGGQVVPAYLDIRKPLDLDAPNPFADPKHPWITNDPVNWAKHHGVDIEGKIEPGQYNTHDIWQRPAFAEAARKAGYDGLTATENGGKTWAALSPDQIKPKLSDDGWQFAEEQKLPFVERQAFRDFMQPPAPQPLPGLPTASPVGPNADLRRAAAAYGEAAGRSEPGPAAYQTADPERGARIAAAFEQMQHDPHNPEVRQAYEALSRETMAQYEGLKKQGYQFDFHPDGVDPYPSPFDAVRDLRDNRRLSVYPTDAGYGTEGITRRMLEENPMLQETGEMWSGKPVRVNDVFRAVHDAYGHAKEGFGFRASGEDMAYQAHAPMFSPGARRALATETRGQNSWLNFGPNGEANRTAKIGDTVFADQKIGLLPDEHVYDGLNLEQRSAPKWDQIDDPFSQEAADYDDEFEQFWGHSPYQQPDKSAMDAAAPPPTDGPLTAARVLNEAADGTRSSGEGYTAWKAQNDTGPG